jgi:hypothetical protein
MSTSPNGVSAPVGSAVTELPADRVRARIDLALLPASTAEIAPLTSVSGQSRAQEAIRFGLGIPAEGYNIAVSGESASGRGTAVRLLVNEFAAKRDSAPDWIYLYNFTDPLRPRAASLLRGHGRAAPEGPRPASPTSAARRFRAPSKATPTRTQPHDPRTTRKGT